MDARTYTCRACGAGIVSAAVSGYAACGHCGSYNILSANTAEADNKDYFDRYYRDISLTPLEVRQTLFHMFLFVHELCNRRQTVHFNKALGDAQQMIVNADKSLEIGFGRGAEMLHLLSRGANLYGVDLSEAAVCDFKMRNPQYADRVSTGTVLKGAYDVVYSNALFEHVDMPGEFLTHVRLGLREKGTLIMRIPVALHPHEVRRTSQDINFWEPCHRILYTEKGLTRVLEDHGFRICRKAHLDYYGYKVMSTFRKWGYTDITYVRNPFFPIKGMASTCHYVGLLMRALFCRIICADYILFAERI